MTYSNLSSSDFLCPYSNDGSRRRQWFQHACMYARLRDTRTWACLLKGAVVWFAILRQGIAQSEGHLVFGLEWIDVHVHIQRTLCVCVLPAAAET